MNYIYGSLHFIVTAGAVIYLYRRWPGDYPRWRNTLALTTVLALIGFVFLVPMPPRLLYTAGDGSYGFVDTLARYPTFWSFDSGAISTRSPTSTPPCPASISAGRCSAPRRWRHGCGTAAPGWPPASHPGRALAAIVVTGNHFFLDAAGGAVVFLAGYGLARRFTRPRPVLTDEPPPDAADGEGPRTPPRPVPARSSSS